LSDSFIRSAWRKALRATSTGDSSPLRYDAALDIQTAAFGKSAQPEIVLDSHGGEQGSFLGHQIHAAAHALFDRQLAKLDTVELDAAAAHRQPAHQRPEQGRLAGAIGADERHQGAGGYVEADVVHRRDRAVADREIPDFEHHIAHPSAPK